MDGFNFVMSNTECEGEWDKQTQIWLEVSQPNSSEGTKLSSPWPREREAPCCGSIHTSGEALRASQIYPAVWCQHGAVIGGSLETPTQRGFTCSRSLLHHILQHHPNLLATSVRHQLLSMLILFSESSFRFQDKKYKMKANLWHLRAPEATKSLIAQSQR